MNKPLIKAVAACEIFRTLPEEVLCSVCDSLPGETGRFEKDETICSPCSTPALRLLLRGHAEVTRDCADGRTVKMAGLRDGSVIGMAGVFGDDDTAPGTVTAKSACTVLEIPREKLEELIRENPDFAVAYVSFLTKKINYLGRRLNIFSSPDPKDRLISMLRLYDTAEDGTVLLDCSVSVLAEKLNIGRATLYRILREGGCGYALGEKGGIQKVK